MCWDSPRPFFYCMHTVAAAARWAMGSGSSVGAPESRGLPIDSSHTSVRVQSLQRSEEHNRPAESRNVDLFTPCTSSRDGIGRESSRRSLRLDYSRPTIHRSTTLTSISEGPTLTQDQESKIKSCLTSLEELLKGSQLRFDIRNILPHAVMMHEEGGWEVQLLDRVGEGLFIVDVGSVDLLSPSSPPAKAVPVIRLAEGDYCGEYSTLFNVPFRIKVQFKSSVDLLHLPADVVRVNMHYTGQLDRDAMLNLSIIQSNLISGELFGEDISNRVVAKCLKASLFSSLGEGAQQFLADTITPLLFSTGEAIYNEGEMATYIFLVLKGTVQLVRQGQHLKTYNVNFSTEGVSIAAKEFFQGSALSHQAIAGGPLVLASIGREQILDMLNKFPGDAEAVKRMLQRR